jgi:ABC-type Mn2+/Zn2+ transport system ATPase subunit
MTDVLLAVDGVTLRYGATTVLRDVDLEVRAGQFWFLLGPNGEGKTTLLRAILGELRPAAGSIRLHPALEDRSALGFVPQRCDANPILPTTVREFVTLGLVGIRADRTDRQSRLAWALEHAGLAGLAERSYWALSGGQRQRALVARALVRRPRLIILDEPTSNLDFLVEGAILDALADLNRQEHTAVLFVTHAIHLADRYATQVALFRGGAVESGPAAGLLRPEHLARVYAASGTGGERRSAP